MKLIWVLGKGGLLGSAIYDSLLREEQIIYSPKEKFNWTDESGILCQIEKSVDEFANSLIDGQHWHIYWAAGVGTMHSTVPELLLETKIISRLTKLIHSNKILNSARGCLNFASSAGAVYAGSDELILNETSSVSPMNAYGFEKVKQEELLMDFGRENPGIGIIISRLSTLYGPGQAFGKGQGLIAEIARRILKNQHASIYVPFDTIRDYIYSFDAAKAMIETSNLLSEELGQTIKIIASESPTTIAEIISIFKNISKRTPRIILSDSYKRNAYNRKVILKSIHQPLKFNFAKTSLLIGISNVYSFEKQNLKLLNTQLVSN
jgi:UDP-glucose 4-epimerase